MSHEMFIYDFMYDVFIPTRAQRISSALFVGRLHKVDTKLMYSAGLSYGTVAKWICDGAKLSFPRTVRPLFSEACGADGRHGALILMASVSGLTFLDGHIFHGHIHTHFSFGDKYLLS